jgi:hypothetical protein
VLADPKLALKMAVNLHKLVEMQFSLDFMIERYCEVYENLLTKQ